MKYLILFFLLTNARGAGNPDIVRFTGVTENYPRFNVYIKDWDYCASWSDKDFQVLNPPVYWNNKMKYLGVKYNQLNFQCYLHDTYSKKSFGNPLIGMYAWCFHEYDYSKKYCDKIKNIIHSKLFEDRKGEIK